MLIENFRYLDGRGLATGIFPPGRATRRPVLESARNESMGVNPEQSLRQLLEATPGVRLAVSFGSAARGDHDANSDLDVGVSFESGADAGQRLEVELSRVSRRRIDLVRLDEAPPLLRFEIAHDGRLLLERVPHAWTDFKARAMVDWWDWAPLAHIFHASALKRIREGVGRGTP